MGTLVKRLDEQLKRYLLEHETVHTWKEWAGWVKQAGCEIALPRPETLSESKRLNYMEWLRYSEAAFEPYPDWAMRLSNPNWLARFDLKIAPEVLREKGTSSSAAPHVDMGHLQTELARLIDQIHVVQQQIGGGRNSGPSSSAGLPPLPDFNEPPSSGALRPLPSTQLLETEMLLKQRAPKPKPKEESHVPELVPLREAYLTFNAWCAQFEELHIHLQELLEEPVLMPRSTHPISFRQFGHRLSRRIQDPEHLTQLERYLKTFERMRQNGVDINLPEPQVPAPEPDGFVAPADTEYQDFNQWLNWLREQGYDPSQFASQPLEVESSHRISFPQFCRRIERRLDDIQGFRSMLNLSE
jgi:hypothetical protein